MTIASRRLAAATALLCVLSGAAAAAQLTNAVTLGVQAADNWTDLGAGPLTVSPVATFSQRQVFVAIADTQPAATAPGEPLFGPRHYEGTSHVWALATAGLPAQVLVTNESTGGAGSGGASGSVNQGNAGSSAWPTTRPDVANTGTLNAATANATYVAPVTNGAATASFTVSGLTASGATLIAEYTGDGGTTWSPVDAVSPPLVPSSSITADRQYKVDVGGRTGVRLRVATTGTGTITIASNVSVAATDLSALVPDGGNVTLGSKADVAAASPSTTASLIATFRGYWSAWTTSAATATLQKVKPPPTAVTMTPSPDWSIPAGASTAMNAANTNRKGLYVVNVGANPCRLNFGAAAAASTGILLPANGGGISQDAGIVTQQALFAYCPAASTISVTEAQ